MRAASPDCSPAYYLIFLVYPFTAAVVVFVRWCWRNSVHTRPLVVLSLAGMFVIQLGDVVYHIRRDPYQSGVSPGGRFLARPRPAGRFDHGHHGQSRVGIYHRLPEQFFVEEIYQGRFDTVLLKNPAQFARLQERLAQYRVIYNEKNYRVLALRPEFKAGAVRPRHTLWRAPMVLVRRQPAHQTMSLDNIDLAP